MYEKGCKGGPGRPKKEANLSQINSVIECGAVKAAQYIRDLASGEIKKPSAVRLDACKFLVNQAIGMPKQRTELTGADGAPVAIKTIEVIISGDSKPN